MYVFFFFINKNDLYLQQINKIDGDSSPPSFFPLRKKSHSLGFTLIPYLKQ